MNSQFLLTYMVFVLAQHSVCRVLRFLILLLLAYLHPLQTSQSQSHPRPLVTVAEFKPRGLFPTHLCTQKVSKLFKRAQQNHHKRLGRFFSIFQPLFKAPEEQKPAQGSPGRALSRAAGGPGLEPATLRPPRTFGRWRRSPGAEAAARKRKWRARVPSPLPGGGAGPRRPLRPVAMSAAGLVSATPPAPAPPGAPAAAMPPGPEYYEEMELEVESAEEEDGERSARARDSDEDTEDASETDLAKHEEEDFVEMKEQMYQDKLASLKRQLQQLQEGTLQEYQKRMKKLDQQYKERIRNAELFLQLETDQVEKNYVKEKKAAAKEFEDKKIELKENLIAELEEKKKMIENEKLTMELTGDSMEVKPIMTRKLRRRPNDPVPIPDKRRKPAPAQLNYLLTDEQIMEDLRTLNKLKSPKRPVRLLRGGYMLVLNLSCSQPPPPLPSTSQPHQQSLQHSGLKPG
ncbi:sin3 histone deacetylase corepressor complex component SDS3 isoform X2 [Colius striatus]|uniref:sin3 histone deacetylase corepressor complex component SDS3 isoform X2 n=1 Tax=Colius striatus TaxID=57412 RepID=UPI002B1D296F|nr:sin3 histone deacetylase corepressor complex component SDS3 isoform X2 [Colius striatus]